MARGQLKLFDVSVEHGGDLSTGKRKTKRPFSSKKAVHLTLRSTRAVGKWSMLHPAHAGWIRRFVDKLSKRWGVRVYEFSNNGNHLHVLLRAKTRGGFQNFLRVLSAQIASRITGATKGNAKGKFWDKLAYTRLVEWGKSFRVARGYVVQNFLEATGMVPYKPRARSKVVILASPAPSSG